MPLYCDVSLPVPLDTPFTYLLPPALEASAQPGCRVIVPFGARKLTGVILECHDRQPTAEARAVLRLVDEEPTLSRELLDLGRWIADYYRAPLGETLRVMLPPAIDVRRVRLVSLTPAGQEAARQYSMFAEADDPVAEILRALERRPLAESYLKKKLPLAAGVIRGLERKGLIRIDRQERLRDPLRAHNGRLIVESIPHRDFPRKVSKIEKRLLDFLAAHPGPHEVEALEADVQGFEAAARRLAKAGILRLWKEPGEELAPAEPAPKPELSAGQRAALEAVAGSIRANKFQTFLLHGVTGSGKTEVYLHAIETALELGKSALLLVPEISLTPAAAALFHRRFGEQAAILHSAFGAAERAAQWARIRSGAARVVVGTRSAVFAPLQNLGLVVVDEEHDASYKQEETPRYHGRDVAIVRGERAGATVVLGSATPCLESRYNAARGKYALIELQERIEKRPLPEVDLIDMRLEFIETRQQRLFSRCLLDAIEARLAAGEQVMILLNRRGYSSFVACRSCGERIECQNCSVTLTYHRREQRLLCHYCDYAERPPAACPKCGSEYLYFLGSGSEKVEQTLHEAFPRARIARLDRDTARGGRRYESILGGFREGSFDILVGTQMIAKGHDIPNVTLVGIVSADIGLGLPDFRAAERTFQLLTQVAGRAGRGELPGRVLIQTLNPDHYVIQFAKAHDYQGFYEKELNFRRFLHYPPFAALANILVRSAKLEEALKLSGMLGEYLKNSPKTVRVLGPAAAAMVKLKAEYRYQFLLKASSRRDLGQLLQGARRFAEEQKWPATALVIDVDPMSLM
ncbi:MAG TPA: primosomal protein N' [Bryobacterales bacterium]|jgi:primosomal protein N' (replication factor Y)|nr:primosomal protein N' [Bryobacterales bacterium]